MSAAANIIELDTTDWSKVSPAQRVPLDWKNPDYLPIWQKRALLLQKLNASPGLVADFKLHYKHNPWDFVSDWGVTVDPRVAGQPGRTPLMPFLLMPKQEAFMRWLYQRWKTKTPGTVVKSRDCGLSWLFMSWSVAMCLHWADFRVGVGSAKEDKVDRNGDPDCLFYKGMLFMRYIPRVFRNGWHAKKNKQHMVMTYPGTEASITGEAGDNIGRGGRTSLYGIDESAHTERPKLIDASLSATTDCRIDISSVNGTANSFAERAHNANIARFDFHWRDDPRKDKAWYDAKCLELDPVIVAQELDCNFAASVDGVIIEQAWVQAALDLDKLLGIVPDGRRTGGLDVADLGRDKCAFATKHDFLLEDCISWRGNGAVNGRQWELEDTVAKAYNICDDGKITGFVYDADGMGAQCRGPVRKASEAREEAHSSKISVHPWRGSGAVVDPEKPFPGTQRKAIDYFANAKAQGYFWLRQLFRASYQVRVYFETHRKLPPDFDQHKIICIRDGTSEIRSLCMQLSQPVFCQTVTGKMGVDKAPDETPSPDKADAVMMAFAPKRVAVLVKSSANESMDNENLR